MCVLQQEEQTQEQPTEQYAVDQWILDFANLFREQTGMLCPPHMSHYVCYGTCLHCMIKCLYANSKGMSRADLKMVRSTGIHKQLTFCFHHPVSCC